MQACGGHDQLATTGQRRATIAKNAVISGAPGRGDTVCPTGYADDTQAITLAPAAARMVEASAVMHRTTAWIADTGQLGNAAKCTLWLLQEPPGGVAPLTLGGVAIPLSRGFKQLGVGQGLAAEKSTGPILRDCLHKGLAIMRRLECLPTFFMREAALSNQLCGDACGGASGRRGAPRGARGTRKSSGASYPRASMYLPFGVCNASTCSCPPGTDARHHAYLGASGVRVSSPPPSTGPVGKALQAARQLV